jgi:hypothetical protein
MAMDDHGISGAAALEYFMTMSNTGSSLPEGIGVPHRTPVAVTPLMINFSFSVGSLFLMIAADLVISCWTRFRAQCAIRPYTVDVPTRRIIVQVSYALRTICCSTALRFQVPLQVAGIHTISRSQGGVVFLVVRQRDCSNWRSLVRQ